MKKLLDGILSYNKILIITNNTEESNSYAKLLIELLRNHYNKSQKDYYSNILKHNDLYISFDIFIKKHNNQNNDKLLISYKPVNFLSNMKDLDETERFILYYASDNTLEIPKKLMMLSYNNQLIIFICDDLIRLNNNLKPLSVFYQPIKNIFRDELLRKKIEKLKKKLYL